MRIIGKYSIGVVLCYMIFSFLSCKKDAKIYNYLQPIIGDTLTLTGIYAIEEGDSANNSVFLDLSKGVQTTVLRSSWDLGLYSGTENKVIINHSRGAAVVATKKTDWTNVGVADSTALTATDPSNTLFIYTTLPKDGGILASLSKVDLTSGDKTAYLAGTVITVDPVDANNVVYILRRGSTLLNPAGVITPTLQGMKIRITALKNGYNIEYGPLSDNISRSVQVIKNSSYNFNYVSLAGGAVTVEPGTAYWDLEYTATTYPNPADKTLAIGTTDFMMINFMGGVKAAEIVPLTDGKPIYDNFKTVDTAGITYSTARDAIGVNWRTIIANNPSFLKINTDRFYVIKDAAGNIYKVNFAGGGSRGKPIVQYNILWNAVNKTDK